MNFMLAESNVARLSALQHRPPVARQVTTLDRTAIESALWARGWESTGDGWFDRIDRGVLLRACVVERADAVNVRFVRTVDAKTIRITHRESGEAPTFESGDPEFSSLTSVSGSSLELRALLHAELRKAVITICRMGRLRLGGAWLAIDIRCADLATLDTATHAAFALAARLESVGNLAEKLADLVSNDPLPRVRELALIDLTRNFMGMHVAEDALTRALSDADPNVRMAAICAGGPIDVCAAMWVASHEDTRDDVRAEARLLAYGA